MPVPADDLPPPIGIDYLQLRQITQRRRAETVASSRRHIAAIPAFAVPAETVAILANLVLGKVEAEERRRLRAVLLHHLVPRVFHFRCRKNAVGIPVVGRCGSRSVARWQVGAGL